MNHIIRCKRLPPTLWNSERHLSRHALHRLVTTGPLLIYRYHYESHITIYFGRSYLLMPKPRCFSHSKKQLTSLKQTSEIPKLHGLITTVQNQPSFPGEVHLSNPWHKKTILPSLGSLGLGNMGGHNKLRYWVTLRVKHHINAATTNQRYESLLIGDFFWRKISIPCVRGCFQKTKPSFAKITKSQGRKDGTFSITGMNPYITSDLLVWHRLSSIIWLEQLTYPKIKMCIKKRDHSKGK